MARNRAPGSTELESPKAKDGMFDDMQGPKTSEFTTQDGLELALAYLENPGDVPCPRCGPGMVEVVCFLDASSVRLGTAVPTDPDGDYMVVLYCHACGRAGAVDLSESG